MQENQYDVAVIGAGISGLVCGCYLAKAGLKTVIIEKNSRVGGCCTSFKRKEYCFDSCVHSLSSLKKGGFLRKVLEEIDVFDRIKFKRRDPSENVFFQNKKIQIYHNHDKLINEFSKISPQEKNNIKKFINFIAHENLFGMRSKSFSVLLDEYFHSESIKTIFKTFVLGFIGIHPDEASAIVSCLLIKEFVLDGGYYPEGGIQELPDAICQRFRDYTGRVILNNEVIKINLEKKKIESLLLKNGQQIKAKYYVSGMDIRSFYSNFVDKGGFKKEILDNIQGVKQSLSCYIVYLGFLGKEVVKNIERTSWIIDRVRFNDVYKDMKKGQNKTILFNLPPVEREKRSAFIEVTTDTHQLWAKEERTKMTESLIKVLIKRFPDLKNNIEIKFDATPKTIEKWTGNNLGSSFGLASSIDQFCDPRFSQKTRIDNLYIVGHWANTSSGIPFVADSGLKVGKMIERKMEKK